MPAFRQVGEKQLPQEIIFMAWSPKRDLIALANKIGEVLLHRLANFQRVWSLPPSDSTGKDVTALAWRPDGKILAFGLADTKKVILCDVEKPESLHSFSVDAPITYMHWMEVTEENSVLTSFYDAEDESNLLLPKLPALPKKLNALVLGGNDGFIEIYAYGMYKIATVTGVIGSCLALCLSSDLKSLSVITEVEVSPESDPEITYFQLDTSLLSTYLPEVTRMARKFTHISTLLQYIKLSLTCMCEAWEEILIQMDSRLTKFVQEKNTTTSVQDEFMQLLLWGKASLELQALLMNQLTVKGLKKLGQSMESSYSSIQKLVISHLQSGSEALLYHLSELKGMAAWKQKYECLGLDASGIEEAVTAVGFVPLKVWLIIPTTETHVDVMTQKDITFVADFLTEHFNEAPELYNRKGKYFNVERVGQYLKDEDDDLVSPPNTEGNQWFNFLKNSNHLKESPLLFPYYPQKSLHFVKRQMEGIIDQCLQKPSVSILFWFGEATGLISSLLFWKQVRRMRQCFTRKAEFPNFRKLWNDKTSNLHYVLFTMLENSISKIYILRRPTDVSRYISANGLLFYFFLKNFYSCLDAHFYDDDTITVIITENAEQEGKERILAQLPLSSIYTEENQELEFSWNSGQRLDMQCDGIPTRTVTIEGQWRMLENMKAQYVAVNGVRKVSCVVRINVYIRHGQTFEEQF
uniref:Anaphase-promoting complex subunit 4 n=1 Tax=Anolis carolinensis TaxID=28377 RepID=H9GKA5_ANOCA